MKACARPGHQPHGLYAEVKMKTLKALTICQGVQGELGSLHKIEDRRGSVFAKTKASMELVLQHKVSVCPQCWTSREARDPVWS